jgi:hypothetical protein
MPSWLRDIDSYVIPVAKVIDFPTDPTAHYSFDVELPRDVWFTNGYKFKILNLVLPPVGRCIEAEVTKSPAVVVYTQLSAQEKQYLTQFPEEVVKYIKSSHRPEVDADFTLQNFAESVTWDGAVTLPKGENEVAKEEEEGEEGGSGEPSTTMETEENVLPPDDASAGARIPDVTTRSRGLIGRGRGEGRRFDPFVRNRPYPNYRGRRQHPPPPQNWFPPPPYGSYPPGLTGKSENDLLIPIIGGGSSSPIGVRREIPLVPEGKKRLRRSASYYRYPHLNVIIDPADGVTQRRVQRSEPGEGEIDQSVIIFMGYMRKGVYFSCDQILEMMNTDLRKAGLNHISLEFVNGQLKVRDERTAFHRPDWVMDINATRDIELAKYIPILGVQYSLGTMNATGIKPFYTNNLGLWEYGGDKLGVHCNHNLYYGMNYLTLSGEVSPPQASQLLPAPFEEPLAVVLLKPEDEGKNIVYESKDSYFSQKIPFLGAHAIEQKLQRMRFTISSGDSNTKFSFAKGCIQMLVEVSHDIEREFRLGIK